MPVPAPGPPADHRELIARFVDACSADDRIVAAFLGGSLARGDADEFSDVDLCAVVADDAYDDVVAARAALVQRLGEPLFLEDFGRNDIVFFILADGTEGELNIVREGELRTTLIGAHRPLLDEGGILEKIALRETGRDRAEEHAELEHLFVWFWHELSHFTTALGRDQLWWAAGQLEALRGYCANLVRVDQGGVVSDEPYWKLEEEVPTGWFDELRVTFVPLERGPILGAGRRLLAFFRTHAPDVAQAHGITYPAELDRVMTEKFNDLPE